ncbi:MAG: thiamine phosphate synthase [Pseudomonadota bacterium]
MTRFKPTDLYCITAQSFSRGRTNLEVVRRLIAAGIQVIQYREKDKSMKLKFEECTQIRQMTRQAGVTFIVNDHVDLAMAVDADGIHVGQDDLPVPEIRRLTRDRMIIGLSTHSPEQAAMAVVLGVDYIGAGPIYRTATKTDVCDPVGLGYLEHVIATHDIPVVAIGGIKAHNLGAVTECGATCVAMVTEIVGADDIQGKIQQIRRLMGQGMALPHRHL